MIDLLTLSIGIGLIVSLVFAEKLGRAAGGLIVPGYLALSLTRPIDIALTLTAALATYALVVWLSSVMIVYGRRRTVLALILGFLIGAILRLVASQVLASSGQVDYVLGYTVIGYLIPGLIAIWFDRQGVLDTCTATLTAAAVVRLILVLVAGGELQLMELERMEIALPEWETMNEDL